jgi:tetratricopeptide (TPR) repeat protein
VSTVQRRRRYGDVIRHYNQRYTGELAMNHDWYRGSNWDENDRIAFFSKLNRSRGSHNKAQYVRIKALALSESGKKFLIKEAIKLLNMIIEQWTEEGQLAQVYLQLAECYVLLGEFEYAIDNYERCINTETQYPQSLTYVTTSYPAFIVENNLKKLYDRALEILELNRESNPVVLTDQRFVYHAVRAIIYREKGLIDKSIEEGKFATEEMNKDFSGFSRHANLGLVDKVKRKYLIKRIKHIVK